MISVIVDTGPIVALLDGSDFKSYRLNNPCVLTVLAP